MNETYLIIMGGFILIALILWQSFDIVIDSFIGFFSLFMTSVSGLLMLVFSGLLPLGESLIEVKSATNTRVGDELIIKVEGWPTQVIDNIKFIDKEVQVKKIITQNAWGGNITTSYQVEMID